MSDKKPCLNSRRPSKPVRYKSGAQPSQRTAPRLEHYRLATGSEVAEAVRYGVQWASRDPDETLEAVLLCLRLASLVVMKKVPAG